MNTTLPVKCGSLSPSILLTPAYWPGRWSLQAPAGPHRPPATPRCPGAWWRTFSHAMMESPFVTPAGSVLQDAVALRLSQNKLSGIGVPWGRQGGRNGCSGAELSPVPSAGQQSVPTCPLSNSGSRCYFRTDESILFLTLANEKKWGQVGLDLCPGLLRGM